MIKYYSIFRYINSIVLAHIYSGNIKKCDPRHIAIKMFKPKLKSC